MSISGSLSTYVKALISTRNLSGKSYFYCFILLILARVIYSIGPKYFSLFSLYRVQIDSWGKYILNSEANENCKKINESSARKLVNDKVRFAAWLEEHEFPTIPVVAVLSRRSFLVGEKDFSNDADISQGKVFDKLPDALFFKKVDGSHGEGAFLAKRLNGKWRVRDAELSSAALYQYCIDGLAENDQWIIQQLLEPEARLKNSLSPAALATVRIITVRSEDKVDILGAVLKIPSGDSETDNFKDGAGRTILAAVNVSTGVLGTGWWSKNQVWPEIVSIDRHPDTGAKIEGSEIPFWEAIVATVREAQARLIDLPTLGWDVAITNSGPVIVEANAGYGLVIHQISEQTGFRDKFSAVKKLLSR